MSTRQTRSSSAGILPQPVTYPGYGPRATVPAQGFLSSSDRLLRRTRIIHEDPGQTLEESDGIPLASPSIEFLEPLNLARPSLQENFMIRLAIAGVHTILIRLAIQQTLAGTPTSGAESSPSPCPLPVLSLPT